MNFWAYKRFLKFVIFIIIQLQAKNSKYIWTLLYFSWVKWKHIESS